MNNVTIRGVKISFVQEGKGKPIFFLHGNAGTHKTWIHQLDYFHRKYNVIAPDHRGYGQSDKPYGQDYSPVALASDIKELMDLIGISSAVIIGHSMGGTIAMQFCIQYMNKVEGLVLVSTIPHRKFRNTEKDLAHLKEVGLETYLEELVQKWMPEEPSDYIYQFALNEALKMEEHIRISTVTALDKFDITDKLNQINVPSLILVGEQDKQTPPFYSEDMYKHINNSELKIIKGCGHTLPLEKPDELNKEIEQFLIGINY